MGTGPLNRALSSVLGRSPRTSTKAASRAVSRLVAADSKSLASAVELLRRKSPELLASVRQAFCEKTRFRPTSDGRIEAVTGASATQGADGGVRLQLEMGVYNVFSRSIEAEDARFSTSLEIELPAESAKQLARLLPPPPKPSNADGAEL